MRDMMTEDEVLDKDDEVGCWLDAQGEEHHGIACDHPTCVSCGTFLDHVDEKCPECGRPEAG